jgi:Pyridine nucleotide-disulphide oxidoreductase
VACIFDRTLRAGRCSPLIEDTTMRVTLLPADAHNQRTITQGHPPTWQNPPGGDYDLVVLGGGPAGLIAALTAAAGGHRVAMTEQRLTGGTCVNFGCTPSKALIGIVKLLGLMPSLDSRGRILGSMLTDPPLRQPALSP